MVRCRAAGAHVPDCADLCLYHLFCQTAAGCSLLSQVMIFATLQAVTHLCVTLQADAIASIMQAACGKVAAIVQAPMAPASGGQHS